MLEDTVIEGHQDHHRHSQDDRRDEDHQEMVEVLVRGAAAIADHLVADPVEDLVADSLMEIAIPHHAEDQTLPLQLDRGAVEAAVEVAMIPAVPTTSWMP